jgi:hypothetical protein
MFGNKQVATLVTLDIQEALDTVVWDRHVLH